MRTFDLNIEPITNAPQDAFTFLPEKIFIKEQGITEDYESIKLMVQVFNNRVSQNPMVTSHVNIDQTELVIPLADYKNLFTETGDINNDAANVFLQGFGVMIKPEEIPVISQTDAGITQPETTDNDGILSD